MEYIFKFAHLLSIICTQIRKFKLENLNPIRKFKLFFVQNEQDQQSHICY